MNLPEKVIIASLTGSSLLSVLNVILGWITGNGREQDSILLGIYSVGLFIYLKLQSIGFKDGR